MAELILHHYPQSPFAEKIRLVLGFKGLAWRSVHIPMMMPKPDLTALTGGYRRTPVLQIGADIYCDTALICEVLEHLQPQPSLYPDGDKGLSRVIGQWADDAVFPVAMAWNFQPQGAALILQGMSAELAKAFVDDRTAMRMGAPRMLPADAAATYKSYLRRLSSMLETHDHLLGERPCVADFCAYHPLWFTADRVPPVAWILDATPRVRQWLDRMKAIGHGPHAPMEPLDALKVSASSQPAQLAQEAFQDEHGIALGSRVTVAASHFGPEPTEGELIAATRTRYTLRRSDARAGTVHVHFPRIGFTMKKVSP